MSRPVRLKTPMHTSSMPVLSAGGSSASGRGAVRRGFTLIELLVVIAVISLLMAMLIPSLTKAKQLAHEVRCISHLRALILAQVSYDGDFGQLSQYYYEAPGTGEEKNVPWFYWLRKHEFLPKYAKWQWAYSAEGCRELTCASVPTEYASYTMNVQDYGLWTCIEDFKYASSMILLGDGTYWLTYGCMANLGYRYINGTWRWDLAATDDAMYQSSKLAPRHREAGNFAYADGHVERVSMKDRPEGTEDYRAWMWNGEDAP